MSRYGLSTNDENLEVFMGFEEGLGTFFLTLADARTCTGEPGTYLFHNYDHHPRMGMTLEEVIATLELFGIAMPADLFAQLAEDAKQAGAEVRKTTAAASPGNVSTATKLGVLGWQSAL